MNEDELKPCPFCGGEVEIEQTGKNELRVRCKECHMGLKQKVLRKSLEWLEETLRNSWNTRPSPSVESVEERKYGGQYLQWWVDTVEEFYIGTDVSKTEKFLSDTLKALQQTHKEKYPYTSPEE